MTARTPLFISLVMCLAMLPLLAVPAEGQQTPDELVQSALYKQQVEGDLEGAVKIFEGLIEDFPQRREIVARALVQLGQAHETLGDTEAHQAAYRRVLSDYPDQTEAAAEARSRLATLPSDDQAARRVGIVTRQVWPRAGSSVDVGSISPDGRYVAFVDWGSVRGHTDLAVYDTETGQYRLLTDKPRPSVSDAYVEGMAWSTDGERLAYSVWTDDFAHQELHVLRSDGSDDHILVANDERPNVRPLAWSPDGDFIVCLFVSWDDLASIGIVSTEDGSVQILKTVGEHNPWPLSLSPDGKYIVYDYFQADDVETHDVFILATDGSSEERLVSHSADDERPFWTPDGERVVFLSDRSGRRSLYAMEVRDGRAAGDPEVVRRDVGPISTLGFSRSGALYYQLDVNVSDVDVAELDLDGTGTLSEVSPLTERFEGTNRSPSWSPDGEHIAYYSRRGLGQGDYAVVKSLATGDERYFAIPPLRRRPGNPEWSADGRHLLIEGVGGGAIERPGLPSYRLDLETGEVAREAFRRDEAGKSGGDRSYATSVQEAALRAASVRIGVEPLMPRLPDLSEPLRPGETLLWVDGDGLGRWRPGGEVVTIGPRGHIHSWALSPNGAQLAWAVPSDIVNVSDRLLVMPIVGGEIRDLTRLTQPSEVGVGPREIVSMKWTPDGKTLLYQVEWPDRDGEPELWQVRVEGGAPARLDLPLLVQNRMVPSRLSFHPDGRTIAFWTERGRSEVWLMEGFPWQDAKR